MFFTCMMSLYGLQDTHFDIASVPIGFSNLGLQSDNFILLSTTTFSTKFRNKNDYILTCLLCFVANILLLYSSVAFLGLDECNDYPLFLSYPPRFNIITQSILTSMLCLPECYCFIYLQPVLVWTSAMNILFPPQLFPEIHYHY